MDGAWAQCRDCIQGFCTKSDVPKARAVSRLASTLVSWRSTENCLGSTSLRSNSAIAHISCSVSRTIVEGG